MQKKSSRLLSGVTKTFIMEIGPYIVAEKEAIWVMLKISPGIIPLSGL